MDITVNGEAMRLESPLVIRELLERLGLADRPCAVEINRAVVTRDDHGTTVLADGDVIEIVTLVGGG
ncbi:MAG: thiamine biosynthesis protein ThiS [Phycisphaerae bacterium]|nr:thiamine biosynthesis protein ThiS [Phycisphaerae bacterium]